MTRSFLLLAATAVLGAGLSGCGRSAPQDVLGDTSTDPEIAGVSITSPDAVVSTSPGSETLPVTSTTAPAAAGTNYTVKPGDTLSKIAGQYGITIQALAELNGITDVNTIKPGQELLIPIEPVEVTVLSEPDSATTASLLKP